MLLFYILTKLHNCDKIVKYYNVRRMKMKHIKTITKPNLGTNDKIGCGECQSSCQTEYKTEPPTAYQPCEKQVDNK